MATKGAPLSYYSAGRRTFLRCHPSARLLKQEILVLLFQTTVLMLQLRQPFNVGHLRAAAVGLSLVVGHGVDGVLPPNHLDGTAALVAFRIDMAWGSVNFDWRMATSS